MRLRAHAKLNLGLAVGRRLANGYHEVSTVIQTIDLADTLDVRVRRSGLRVSNDAGIPLAEDLCRRAAELALRAKGRPPGISIDLRKRIPVGGGLGGGSSDAAAVLLAVDRLVPPALPEDRLHALAAQLGADVPLFLQGGRLLAVGRGDIIAESLPPCDESFVLVIPPFRCATAAVYDALQHIERENTDLPARPALGRNDLLPAAVALQPSLRDYVGALQELAPLYAGLTGSGSACFAAFAAAATAQRATEHLQRSLPEAHVITCRGTRRGVAILEESLTCTSP